MAARTNARRIPGGLQPGDRPRGSSAPRPVGGDPRVQGGAGSPVYPTTQSGTQAGGSAGVNSRPTR